MIPAIAHTLAQIFVEGTSLKGTEQIDFNAPGRELMGKSVLTVYCYSIRENQRNHPDICAFLPIEVADVGASLDKMRWFDVSFLVVAWDRTALGEQQLLSEALSSLVKQSRLHGNLLPHELVHGHQLPFVISPVNEIERMELWQLLDIPIRPALYVTVSIPFHTEVISNTQVIRVAC